MISFPCFSRAIKFYTFCSFTRRSLWELADKVSVAQEEDDAQIRGDTNISTNLSVRESYYDILALRVVQLECMFLARSIEPQVWLASANLTT